MIRVSGSTCIAALAFAFALGGPSAGSADATRYIPVLEQRAAILECRREMGLRGAARFGGEWPEIPAGGQTITWIAPSPNLAPAQADRINECADSRLGRAPTPRFTSSVPVERTVVQLCPRGASVLVGGNGYCPQ